MSKKNFIKAKNPVQILPYDSHDDLRAIVRMAAESKSARFLPIATTMGYAQYVEDGGWLYLIRTEKRIVGYMIFRRDEKSRQLHLDELVIRESHRRRGYGQKALLALEGRAKLWGSARICTSAVSERNVDAQRFLRDKGGFRCDPQRIVGTDELLLRFHRKIH